MFFFGKFTAEQVLISFSGRNNSVKPPAFGLCDSLPFGLEESRKLRALIRWVLGYYTCKNAQNFCQKSLLF